MSTRGGKDRPASENLPKGEDLLTSEDLFGDLVDKPSEASSTPARRSAPIRVKVREQLAPPPPQEAPKPLAPDVEALLEAFSGPGEAATREPLPPPPVEELKKEETRPATRLPVEAAPEELDTLLEVLDPRGAEEPQVPRSETIAGSSPILKNHVPASQTAEELEILPEAIADSSPLLAALESHVPPVQVSEELAIRSETIAYSSPLLAALESHVPPVQVSEELAIRSETIDDSSPLLAALDPSLSVPEPVPVPEEPVVEVVADHPAEGTEAFDPLVELETLDEPKAAPPEAMEPDLLEALEALEEEEEPKGSDIEPEAEAALLEALEEDDSGSPAGDSPVFEALEGESMEPPPKGLGSSASSLLEALESAEATPAEPMGPKFHIAPPSSEGHAGVDLAAVAETAFSGLEVQETEFGPYKLLEKLAVGGMAEVFRAKRPGVEGFEKIVAVKRILPHLSDNKEFVDMFVNEAKMVAGLSHPNIVQIHDLGKIDKSYYIAMEYVHGKDLRTIQKRAKEKGIRIPLELSLYIVGRVCLALEYAHRKKDDRGHPMQIVHRDVSPQNVLISYEGEVKLTDFGIAKAASKAPTTDAGALRGKLLYMSPEQAWGKAIDKRSDLFSLGIVFYELITEQRPFLGSSEASILELVRECRLAPPSQWNPQIPEKVERVLMKILAREPGQRFQDASKMFKDLERALPDRKPAAGTELARFMEFLFEVHGPPQAIPEELLAPKGGLEIDLDSSPGPVAPKKAPATSTSIEKLLARFGIK